MWNRPDNRGYSGAPIEGILRAWDMSSCLDALQYEADRRNVFSNPFTTFPAPIDPALSKDPRVRGNFLGNGDQLTPEQRIMAASQPASRLITNVEEEEEYRPPTTGPQRPIGSLANGRVAPTFRVLSAEAADERNKQAQYLAVRAWMHHMHGLRVTKQRFLQREGGKHAGPAGYLDGNLSRSLQEPIFPENIPDPLPAGAHIEELKDRRVYSDTEGHRRMVYELACALMGANYAAAVGGSGGGAHGNSGVSTNAQISLKERKQFIGRHQQDVAGRQLTRLYVEPLERRAKDQRDKNRKRHLLRREALHRQMIEQRTPPEDRAKLLRELDEIDRTDPDKLNLLFTGGYDSSDDEEEEEEEGVEMDEDEYDSMEDELESEDHLSQAKKIRQRAQKETKKRDLDMPDLLFDTPGLSMRNLPQGCRIRVHLPAMVDESRLMDLVNMNAVEFTKAAQYMANMAGCDVDAISAKDPRRVAMDIEIEKAEAMAAIEVKKAKQMPTPPAAAAAAGPSAKPSMEKTPEKKKAEKKRPAPTEESSDSEPGSASESESEPESEPESEKKQKKRENKQSKQVKQPKAAKRRRTNKDKETEKE